MTKKKNINMKLTLPYLDKFHGLLKVYHSEYMVVHLDLLIKIYSYHN